jgi:putative chitinase
MVMAFSFDFKPEHTRQILKGNAEADEWHAALVEILPKWKITTPNRVAAFMAQTTHESGNYRTLEENLNYGWQGLRKIFPRYFPTDALAKQYERQPEKIANRVYDDANRVNKMGNTAPGDGWKFRGRGIIQLTGKNNYVAFAADVGMTVDQVVEYVQTKKGAVESAAWFWSKRNINTPADAGDIDKVSTLVNGGTIGLTERRENYREDLAILGSAPAAIAAKAAPTTPKNASVNLKRGSSGPDVVRLQKGLGISADGKFGPGTEKALKEWQTGSGLPATGVADAATLKKITG